MEPPLHHALVLPFPLQGHISPLLQLSQHLAASHGFRITFVNTEHNHARFVAESNNLSNDKRINMVGLPDGLPLDAERKASDMQLLVESMPRHMMPALEQLISGTNQSSASSSSCKITCIIADIFLPWAHDLAKKAGVPAFIGFHASSIAQFSFLYHIPLLISNGQVDPDGTISDARDKFTGIPGVLDIPVSSVPWLLGDPVRNKETFQGLASVRTFVDQLDCLLFNSFTEIEKEAVEALAEETDIKMAPIGPMLLLESSSTHDGESKSNVSDGFLTVHEKECLEWLDGRPKGSVLYVAFGTTARLSTEDLHALARGIEASQVPFLWVLRSDLLNGSGSAHACLPRDFLERTKGLAYFTPWAPQTLVLSHPSVGAFLSHGGWNSTLEAICAGVPILMWPDFWDQKFHAEQVVEQWQVGLLLRRTDGRTVEQQGVERLVRCVMHGREGEEMRQRAVALKDKARLAVAKDSGSSYNHLRDVILSLGKTQPSCQMSA